VLIQLADSVGADISDPAGQLKRKPIPVIRAVLTFATGLCVCRNGNPHPYAGKPCWKLVPEGEGSELDVSAERCRVLKTVTVNKTSDADKEAWCVAPPPLLL
jgi:hypothetical protein